MAAEDPSGEVVSTEEQCPDCSASERSFDLLAKGLAKGTMPRRQALRILGGVLVGGTLASVPGAAWAARCKPLLQKCSANRQCCSKNCIKNPRGRGRICGCPTGQTLCPANNSCVPNCPSGQALNPTTCQCTQCQNASECPIPDSECQRATCTNGVCGVENVPDGTSCDDGNPCTTNDVCAAGVCAGTLTEGCVQCQADPDCASVPVDQCHRAVCGTEGFCVVENKPDNASCDDGNPCTENDVCTAGVCAGTPVAGCVPCQTDTDCSGGKTCQGGRCACPTGQELCSGQCVQSCSGGRVLNPATCECECPTGTTLCPGNNTCVQNCPSGQTLNATTCQCESIVCPAQTCCCHCFKTNPVTGNQDLLFCSTAVTTREECQNICFNLPGIDPGGVGQGFGCASAPTTFTCKGPPCSPPSARECGCMFTAC